MKLYELAYACRLYQGEFDDYCRMRNDLGDDPDLASRKQQDSLLEFLNKWGCRIPKKHFEDLGNDLKEWAADWIGKLPQTSVDILSLRPYELEVIARSFNELLLVPHLG